MCGERNVFKCLLPDGAGSVEIKGLYLIRTGKDKTGKDKIWSLFVRSPEYGKEKRLVMALRAISEASGYPHVFGLSDIKRFADDALADFEKKEE